MSLKVSEINGTVKVRRIPTRYKTIKEYEVILFRGSEDKLIEKLEGDIKNLISFCDNGFKFDDLTARHYGGTVQSGWVVEKEVFGKIYTNFSTGSKPSEDSRRAYRIEVYID